MKKFEFRLASVLRLRDVQLNAEKIKLQELFAERERLHKNLASVDAERKEALAFVQKAEGASSTDLRALSAFLLASQARETTVRQAIEGCNSDITDQRSHVMAAERNHKLLLKLKEKRLTAWRLSADQELELIAQEAWQSAATNSARKKTESFSSSADKILASNS